MTREITHMKAFTAALESMGKPRFAIGSIPPTAGLVDQFFNDSTGQGDDGEIDVRGPWNEGDDLQMVESPAFSAMAQSGGDGGMVIDDRTTSSAAEPDMIEALLVEELQDLLDAEAQLVNALPKMSKAAHSDALRLAFDNHLEETRIHLDRLKEVFGLLGVPATAVDCKGMAGLLQEGDEVMEDGEEKDDIAADLSLIAAAQKLEHYEMSAYGTARTMAAQVGLPNVALLLSKTLAEEQIADSWLTQTARELVGQMRTGEAKRVTTQVPPVTSRRKK